MLTQGSQGWVITFSPLLRAMLVAGAGHQPVEGPNWDCPLLPCPGQPRLVQGFPLHIYLPLSLFSFFLPFSLLAVTPSPLHSTPPTLPMGCTRWHFTGRPPPKPQICTVFYFPEQQKKKGAECCLDLEQVTKTFQKPSKYISFSVPRTPAAPWAERKGSCSARGGDSRSPSGQEPSGFCLFP